MEQISTKLTKKDIMDTWKARWGINRMNYKMDPGLYCVGEADELSPVLVTANYKMSFDMLRKELTGINAWILVLDTKGINVWCAAGKGTFGTDELVTRISEVNLLEVVSHKTLILPQLSAPGIAAHEVQKKSGFKVVYGPVRASDIKEFITNGIKTNVEMRKVNFTLYDRLRLTPVEIVGALKAWIIIFGSLLILNFIHPGSFGVIDFYGFSGAILAGCFLVPVLLPWIPGNAFAWKGWQLGIIWVFSMIALNSWLGEPDIGLLRMLGYDLVLPSISAYFAMNFTGCSTYTSLSGVKKEMKFAVPLILVSFILGVIAILYDSFIYIG